MILASLGFRHEPTVRAVISAEPADAQEPSHKAFYLIAVVLCEHESLDGEQVQQVAASLAPFM